MFGQSEIQLDNMIRDNEIKNIYSSYKKAVNTKLLDIQKSKLAEILKHPSLPSESKEVNVTICECYISIVNKYLVEKYSTYSAIESNYAKLETFINELNKVRENIYLPVKSIKVVDIAILKSQLIKLDIFIQLQKNNNDLNICTVVLSSLEGIQKRNDDLYGDELCEDLSKQSAILTKGVLFIYLNTIAALFKEQFYAKGIYFFNAISSILKDRNSEIAKQLLDKVLFGLSILSVNKRLKDGDANHFSIENWQEFLKEKKFLGIENPLEKILSYDNRKTDFVLFEKEFLDLIEQSKALLIHYNETQKITGFLSSFKTTLHLYITNKAALFQEESDSQVSADLKPASPVNVYNYSKEIDALLEAAVKKAKHGTLIVFVNSDDIVIDSQERKAALILDRIKEIYNKKYADLFMKEGLSEALLDREVRFAVNSFYIIGSYYNCLTEHFNPKPKSIPRKIIDLNDPSSSEDEILTEDEESNFAAENPLTCELEDKTNEELDTILEDLNEIESKQRNKIDPEVLENFENKTLDELLQIRDSLQKEEAELQGEKRKRIIIDIEETEENIQELDKEIAHFKPKAKM